MGRDELVTDVVKATRPARKPWRYGVNVRVCSAYRPPEAPRATLHDSTRPICCASRDSKVLAGGPTARGGGRGASPTQLRAALQKASIQAPCTVRQQGVWQAPPNRGPGSHHRAPGPNRPPWALSPAPVPPHSPLSSKAQCWQIQHGHRPHQGGPRRTTHRPGAAAVHVQ